MIRWLLVPNDGVWRGMIGTRVPVTEFPACAGMIRHARHLYLTPPVTIEMFTRSSPHAAGVTRYTTEIKSSPHARG